MISWSFSTADGQMNIELIYFKSFSCAFDWYATWPKTFFSSIFWVVIPPWGIEGAPPAQFWFKMKILVKTNVHVKIQLPISFGVDMLPSTPPPPLQALDEWLTPLLGIFFSTQK